jgi:hypothetical protein
MPVESTLRGSPVLPLLFPLKYLGTIVDTYKLHVRIFDAWGQNNHPATKHSRPCISELVSFLIRPTATGGETWGTQLGK